MATKRDPPDADDGAVRTHLVTYHLAHPERTRPALRDALMSFDSFYHITASTWLVVHDGEPVEVLDRLRRCAHPDDRILVTELSSGSAWVNLDVSWVEARRAAATV